MVDRRQRLTENWNVIEYDSHSFAFDNDIMIKVLKNQLQLLKIDFMKTNVWVSFDCINWTRKKKKEKKKVRLGTILFKKTTFKWFYL